MLVNVEKLTKISELRKRHKRSTEVKDQCIIMEDNGKWTVSSTFGADTYHIKPSTTNFLCNCNIKCTDCIHSYRCSCPDSSIKSLSWNMCTYTCKHVHLLRMSPKGKLSTIEEREDIGHMVIDCDSRKAEENIILKKKRKNAVENTNQLSEDSGRVREKENEPKRKFIPTKKKIYKKIVKTI
ncbi:unnamed protein product [Brassicogethes aeneus]|uniref:SWIM-type domain-containing protein n=1 Tax=Brassicogethes aeneus TaxID=1431903 RepID=A0A9P0BGW5_BRAAE|nr:unnamed protein product [Brassicogethes aeneus]